MSDEEINNIATDDPEKGQTEEAMPSDSASISEIELKKTIRRSKE